MRTLKSDRERFGDARAVYTLLLSVSVVAVLLWVAVSEFSDRLHEGEVSRYYESLTLCADALEEWSESDNAGERYGASLRFEHAAATLPEGVPMDALMSLADHMRMGDTGRERIRAYTDGFVFLSSRVYKSADEARMFIAKTLGDISLQFDVSDGVSHADELPAPEILHFTHDTAVRSMKRLLGDTARGLELVLFEDGATWRAEAENIRIDYSCSDGALEELVYIRVGYVPENYLSEEECSEKALAFYRLARGASSDAAVCAVSTDGGFSLCEISDGDELWRVCIDCHGRVWSFMRAKTQ